MPLCLGGSLGLTLWTVSGSCQAALLRDSSGEKEHVCTSSGLPSIYEVAMIVFLVLSLSLETCGRHEVQPKFPYAVPGEAGPAAAAERGQAAAPAAGRVLHRDGSSSVHLALGGVQQ